MVRTIRIYSTRRPIRKSSVDRKTRHRLLAILACTWAVIIMILTLTPGKYVPSYTLFSYDKLGHTGIFCIQALLIMFTMSFSEKNYSLKRILLTGSLVAIVYGFMIELIQGFIPDRSMDIFDALANISGSFLALLLFYLLNRKKTAKSF